MSKGGNTATSTATNTLDPFVKDIITRGFTAASNVASTPYQPYTGPRIANFRPEEIAGFDITREAVANKVGQGELDAAIAAAKEAAGYSPETFKANVSGFMSPYQESVVDTTMRRLAQSRAERDAETRSRLASSKAFGGDRRGVYEAQLAGEQDLNEAQTLANLYSTGYDKAAGLAERLPASKLAAASSLAGLGASNLGMAGTRAGMIGGVGSSLRDMAQRNLDVARADFLEQRGYPAEQLKILLSGISGVPATTSSTTTSTQPGQGFLGTASDVAGILGSLKKLGIF
jgi:hypothetical protein